jgi:tRNA dimethylallyltransferase
MAISKKSPHILFLIGPTAVGKSHLAYCLARHLKGEIISADSMLVYRGMNVGTAKPTRAERKKIKHHLIDVIKPTETYSVFTYRKQALKTIEAIIKRGHVPIVVGGSGLYISSLLEGLTYQPAGSQRFRKKMMQLVHQKGTAALYERLLKLDSKRAGEICATDERRLIRALEIIEFSPKASSESKRDMPGLESLGYRCLVVGLTQERLTLYKQINQRVLDMIDQGWLLEAKRLNRLRLSQTAQQAIGYRELFDYLRGTRPWNETIELIQCRTRHLAKKQWTWFHKKHPSIWIKMSGPQSKKKAEIQILKLWKKFTSLS